MEADENYPDSVFVEDNALIASDTCAIISNPGAPSRKGEITNMIPTIESYFPNGVEYVKDPGCCEPGDIMMVGNHFYIGLSKRTNQEGAN